jgi:hypothetical protein
MTLLDAPKYDPAHDRKIRNLLIAAGVSIVLIAVIGVGGFFAGHGWFFDNLGIEYRVSTFLKAVQSNDLDRAYGIWLNDPEWKQHPQNPNYDFTRFQDDWGPKSRNGEGDIKSYKVKFSKRTGTGCIVAVSINGAKRPLFLWYEKSTGRMSFSPLELEF